MEPLWNLVHLLEPSSLVLIASAVFVVVASAQRALSYERDAEKHRDFAEASITLDSQQALMIPLASSCSLLLMFYLFSSLSQLVTVFTAVAAASSLAFCVAPYVALANSKVGPLGALGCGGGGGRWWSCQYCGPLTRTQAMVALVSLALVAAWLFSGHWMLNNILGVSICIAFVSHVRLPNAKICALLLACLFVYDIFWVFFSERFFGANVMVSVATQQASNPMHTFANSLNLPGSNSITQKLDLPVKLLFPRNLLGGASGSRGGSEFMMLGLGDMAIPGMLLALVLCFDHRKGRGDYDMDIAFPKGYKYIWFAAIGYGAGLVAALAAGVLTRAPQPALLYLVPSTLGPVSFAAWTRSELTELWNGPRPIVSDKLRLMEV